MCAVDPVSASTPVPRGYVCAFLWMMMTQSSPGGGGGAAGEGGGHRSCSNTDSSRSPPIAFIRLVTVTCVPDHFHTKRLMGWQVGPPYVGSSVMRFHRHSPSIPGTRVGTLLCSDAGTFPWPITQALKATCCSALIAAPHLRVTLSGDSTTRLGGDRAWSGQQQAAGRRVG